MSFVCLSFVLTPHIELSVVFDFNASLNDVAPVSPMMLPVDMKRKWKEFIVDGCLLCLLSFVFTPQIEFRECCVWFEWFTQWCCSCVSNVIHCWCDEKGKRVICWWMSFVCLLSFVFTTQIKFGECCVWFQWFTQWCCSCFSNLVVCWCDENTKRVICWWMPFVCLLSFVFTIKMEFRACCVWFQCLT